MNLDVSGWNLILLQLIKVALFKPHCFGLCPNLKCGGDDSSILYSTVVKISIR